MDNIDLGIVLAPPDPLPTPPKWIPPPPPPRSATPSRRDSSRSSTAKELTLQLTAEGSRAALIYGRVQMAPQIGAVAVSGGYLYLQLIWGLGEIQEIESIVTDAALTSKFSVTHYLGTDSQGVDPWLAAVITDYADTLRGTVHGRDVSIAYSVMRTNKTDLDLRGDFVGTLKGRLVYDPRTPGYAYSTNPALALADVLTMAGETMDWTTVETVADFCDEVLAEQARWTIGMVFDNPTDVPSLVEELRAYAHCLVVPGANGLRLVADDNVAASHTLTVADVIEGSLRISRRSRSETPTVVRVEYTRTDTTPWSTSTAQVALPTVATGDDPWRESNTAMHGIQSYAEAYRTALERLNAYNLRDLEVSFRVADSGLAVVPGDVVSLTHPWGLTSKLLRVLSTSSDEAGRWALETEEFDSAVYSDSVQSEPSYGDTSLPSPFNVPAVTGLTAVEEPYQLENDLFATRFRVTWSSTDYLYQHRYYVKVSTGGQQVASGYTPDAVWVTGPLQEGNTYTITVAIVGELVGVTGAASQTVIVAEGKGLVPGNVTGFTGFEVGGEVRLTWDPVIDDIWRYEVRYGTTSTAWADMNVIDRVDSLRLISKDIPAGEWKFAVKAIDSVGQYSVTEATRTITVTLDTGAFFVDEDALDYTSGTYIYADTMPDGTVLRWSEVGTDFTTLFPNNIETYTDIAASYDGGSVSEWLSETFDLGEVYVGYWQWDSSPFSALGAGDSITAELELSANGTDWGAYTDPAVKVSARYARVRVSAAAGNVLFQDGTLPVVRLDVVTREEIGTVNCVSTDSGGTLVTLSQSYAFANAIFLQPSGTTSAVAVYDDVQLGPPVTFDVYLFDAAGARASGPVSWRFQGV